MTDDRVRTKTGPEESWPVEAVETYNALTRRIHELEGQLIEAENLLGYFAQVGNQYFEDRNARR